MSNVRQTSKCAILTVTVTVVHVTRDIFSHLRNTDSDISSHSAAGKLFWTVGPLTAKLQSLWLVIVRATEVVQIQQSVDDIDRHVMRLASSMLTGKTEPCHADICTPTLPSISHPIWLNCSQVQQYKTRCGELELESRRCPADVSLVTCQFFTYLLTQRVDLSSAITLRLHTARVCTQSVTSVTDTDAWTQTDTYMRQSIS